MDNSTAVLSRLWPIVATGFLSGAVLIVLASIGKPRRVATRLWTAYATEVGILAAILVPAYLGVWALLLSALIIGVVSARELYGVLRRIGLAPRDWPGVVAGGCLIMIAAFGSPAQFHAAFVGFALIIFVVAALRRPPGVGMVASGGATAAGVVYPCALLAYVLLLERLDGGFGYVVFLFCLIEINDSFALLVGSLIGGPKIWPRLSPNKTVAGSLAGLVATVVGAGLLAFAVPALTTAQALAAGFLVGVLGQAGDLVASAIKRRAGVKDFSALVPTQGGILDIYDALIFTAPAFYVGIQLVVTRWR
jgi:phosphatidate cytidylyltransferase